MINAQAALAETMANESPLGLRTLSDVSTCGTD
ncbi:hypothetical protein ABID43_003875 [Methylobacterium goesingense]|uniref:Uncharacterized protein n=1 Tax=Methylobacterium goesingense TaxID=243690 RepID=A0ABV2L8Y1_9HYPH